MAASAYYTQVQNMYVAYFGRPADKLGLEYYAKLLDKNGGNDKAMLHDFANSTESKGLYNQTALSAKINAMYNILFGRDGDLEGITHWASEVQLGRVILSEVAAAIAFNAQPADKAIYEAKLTAAAAFTAKIDSAAELTAYETNPTAGRTWLATVKDAASATTAQASIDTTLAAVVASIDTNVGQTFTLTTGKDTIVGTSGNDTINVDAVNPTSGAGATLLGATDSIDGGAGVDTVNITVDGSYNATIVGTFANVEKINIDNTTATSAAVVDASKFGAAAQSIAQIGKAANVTKLATTTTAVFKGVDLGANQNAGVAGTVASTTSTTGSSLSVQAAATASSANIKLDGVKGDAATAAAAPAVDYTDGDPAAAAGTLATVKNQAVLAVSGAALNTVTVSGTIAQKTVSTAAADASSLKLDVTVGADSTGKGLSTLSITTDQTTALSVANSGTGTGVTAIQGFNSTGGITFAAGGLTSIATITTGSGKDDVTITTATAKDDANTSTDETVNAYVGTGAGDDKVTVNVSGTGKATVETGDGKDTVIVTGINSGGLSVATGAGDDKVDISAITVTTKDLLDGGEGNDTLIIAGKAAFAAGDYLLLDATTKGFDTLQFKAGTAAGSGTAVDASQLAKFAALAFGDSGTVTKVADAQALSLLAKAAANTNLTATSASYVAKTATVAAVLEGTLGVTSTEDAALLTLNAGTANVAVKTAATAAADVGNTVAGDLKTLNVTLASTSTVDADGVKTGAESLAKVTVDLDASTASSTGAATLVNLTSVVVSGAGVVTIDARDMVNTTSAETIEATTGDVAGKLTTIDLSGMTALVNLNVNGDQVTGAAVDNTTYGYKNLSTSTVTLNDAVAETVKLGGALDTVVTNSSYTKMDTITGFELVASASDAKVVNAAKSDVIDVAGSLTFTKFAVSSSTLSGALLEASTAKNAAGTTDLDAVVFVLDGNTYLYVDGNGSTTANDEFDNTDVVVKLTGVYDLDLLVQVVG